MLTLCIILNYSYTTKALEVSKIFNDRQSKPLDTATWWIEHLLNHKLNSEILYSYAVELNWFIFYSLDVITILLAILVLNILFVTKVLKTVLCKSKPTKSDKLKSN